MNKIEKDLKEAFAGESQANRRYLAFAKKAEEEGFKQIAKLFRAAAEAETIHAMNHLKALDGVKSTKENLKMAIDGELYEFTKMYPEFIKDADEENNKQARRTFGWANEVEKIHHKLYNEALNSLNSGKDLSEKKIYVCEVCGMTIEGEVPDKCPVCGASKSKFKEIE